MKTQLPQFTDILKEIIKENKSILSRPEEFISILNKRVPGALARQANPVRIAIQKNVGEMLLVADMDESQRDGLEERIAELLAGDGMQQKAAERVAVELVEAMAWGDVEEEDETEPEPEIVVEEEKRIGNAVRPAISLVEGKRESLNKEVPEYFWTCSCGARNTGNFCAVCGNKKGFVPSVEEVAQSQKQNAGNQIGSISDVTSTDRRLYAIVIILLCIVGGLAYTIISNDDDSSSKPAAVATSEPVKPSIQANNSKPKETDNSNVDKPKREESKPKPSPKREEFVSVEPFIQAKDKYDREITNLATNINAHLQSNPDFRNGKALIERATDISRSIHDTRKQLATANIEKKAIKSKLLDVLDTEIIRIDCLVNGMKSSANGGNWENEFKKGTAAAYKFDDVNEELKQLLK